MSGLTPLAGGRPGAPAIVRSPARLRLLLGPAKAAAAAAAGDLVVTFSADDVDPAVVSQFLSTTWGQEVGSGTVDQQMVNTVNVDKNEYGDNGLTPEDAPGTTITTSVNPNAVSSTNITIDVPGGDAVGQSSLWLSGLVATLISSVAYILTATICLAAFGPVVGAAAGTFAPFAVAICGAVSNGISTLVWFLVGRGFSCGWTAACFGDATFLAVTFCSTLVSAGVGAIGFFPAYAAGPLRRFTIFSAGKIRDGFNAALTWVSRFFTVQIPQWANAVYDTIVGFANKIAGAFRQAAGNAGQATGQAPVPLQPMALGDSITGGSQSTDGAGYRCELQSYLDNSADTYNFVGSLSQGTCSEPFVNGGSFWPQNEGHSGETISGLQSIESCTIKGYEPNVVFLDIGTNDINNGMNPNAAATAEENLINSILADDPGVVVVVGGLIPTGAHAADNITFNKAVSSWISGGSAHVVYADMGAVGSFDLADGLNPNDDGYVKMAYPWLAGLDTAITNGWVHAPNPAGAGCGAPAGSLPCEIYAQSGTPCVAAYSTTRALYSVYDGPLYQVQIASGGGYGATKDIGVLSPGGDVNAAEQDSFCGQYTCVISEIYDQSGRGNNLTVGPAGGAGGADRGAVAGVLPITIGGHEAYGVDITPGVGYRDNSTNGIAVNGQPEGMYMVASGTHVNSDCCFDFGNAEANSQDNGNGHMDAVNLSTACFFAPCSGGGPWVQADMENGLFQGGNGSNTANAGNSSPFVTALLKNNGQDTYALKGGDTQSGGLSTWYEGALPNIGGYAPMHLEGGITLGVGGDNSNRAVGSFFEGVMTAGYPSNQADDAVQANLVAAGYGGNPNGYATGGYLRGSPITMTANGAGQCVDILGDDTGSDGTPADIWSCQSYAVDQHWTQLPNDSLTTLGRCLDLDGDGTAPGTKVELWNCNGVGGQQFVPQANGSLYNPQSGLCLDDPSGSTANGTVLQIWNCLGNAAQNFTFNDVTATSSCSVAPCESNSSMPLEDPGGGYGSPPAGAGTITLAGGQCVNVGGDDGGHDGTIVDVWGCDTNAVDQQWTLESNGSLKNGMGQCLDIDGNGTAPGTKVELWDCNGVGGQVWVPQSNGSLLNPQSGLCLDDPSGITQNAEQLQIWTCNGESPQVFHVNGSPNGGVGSGPPLVGSPLTLTALNGGKCVDVVGNDTGGDGTVVNVWDCQSAAVDQHWTLNSPDDSLETLGRCLDLNGDGTAPGTKVELWDCNGVGGQQWVPQSNGSLYNPQSGLCLDDPSGNTTNGTGLQIWNCLGNAAQVFTFNGGPFSTANCSVAPCVDNSAMPLKDPGGGYAAPPGTAHTITLPTLAKWCVNVGGDDGGHDGTIVDVWSCDPNAVDQQWTWVYNGNPTIAGLENGMGQCLDIDGNGTAPGTKVELWDCNGVGGQLWVSRSDGSLYNPQSGLCLDDPSGITRDGEQLQIWTCNGNPAQVFHFSG